ncbi:MAG: hypothetical protein HOI58_04255 [Kordiimonadaceae bacterium]|jgi:hypothetical protein|nr:hypothetical protein [Kordiimonadaceae bacterium]
MKRRDTLKLIGATAMAAATPKACLSHSQENRLILDPAKAEDLHYIHRKLAFSIDERLTYWYIRAVRYGFKEGVFTPFWNMHVGIIYKLENLDKHKYMAKAALKIFYSDLETGELIETFDNPYTGATRDVLQPKLAKVSRKFNLHGVEQPAFDINSEKKTGPVTRNGNIGPAWIIGDDIWVNGDVIYRAEMPNDLGQLIQVNDWSTYQGSMKQVSDPNLMTADATHTFNDINTFNHPWIGMEGVNAWSISGGFGRKSHSVDGMPDTWRKLTEKTHPELLDDNPDIF